MAQEAFSFTSEQEGCDNQDIKAEEVQRAPLGQEQENNMLVLVSVTWELRLEAGEDVWLDVEWGREEKSVEAEQFLQGRRVRCSRETRVKIKGKTEGRSCMHRGS